MGNDEVASPVSSAAKGRRRVFGGPRVFLLLQREWMGGSKSDHVWAQVQGHATRAAL